MHLRVEGQSKCLLGRILDRRIEPDYDEAERYITEGIKILKELNWCQELIQHFMGQMLLMACSV